MKGGVISSYSLSPEKVASTDYKDLSVREFSAVNGASNIGSVKGQVTVEDSVDNIEKTGESLALIGTLDPAKVHATGATKADAINMLADTSGTVGAVAGSFDLKQLVVQDEGFKSAHINLGDGKTEWLLIANAAETEVTAIRGTGGGGTPENYVLQQPLVIKTYAEGHSLFNTLLDGAKNGRNFAQNKTDQIIDPVYMDVGTLQEAECYFCG